MTGGQYQEFINRDLASPIIDFWVMNLAGSRILDRPVNDIPNSSRASNNIFMRFCRNVCQWARNGTGHVLYPDGMFSCNRITTFAASFSKLKD
jgi:hypothetical protein